MEPNFKFDFTQDNLPHFFAAYKIVKPGGAHDKTATRLQYLVFRQSSGGVLKVRYFIVIGWFP